MRQRRPEPGTVTDAPCMCRLVIACAIQCGMRRGPEIKRPRRGKGGPRPMSEPERVMRRGVRLGVDVGTVRIGVASCDRDGLLATPVETVKAEPRRASLDRLAALAAEYGAFEVVVGLPRSLSGGEGPAAAKIRVYAGELARRLGADVPVRLVDERLSTVTATQGMRA